MSGESKTIGLLAVGTPFDGGTLGRGALGGSETAAIQASRALLQRGHRVTVFSRCKTPGVFDGVKYLPVAAFPEKASRDPWDVFIVSRTPQAFSVPILSEVSVLWNHDTASDLKTLRAHLDRIDLLFFLSAFHRDHYLSYLPEAEDRSIVTRNAINPEWTSMAAEGVKRDPSKVIYASRPERGLKLLLREIWPEILRRRPGTRLHVCGYQVERSLLNPQMQALYRETDALVAATPGVVPLGCLTKRDFYRHLAESAALLYPCTYPETSCIVALEAQACGTPVVTSDRFALSETVKVQRFKVKGYPGSEAYVRQYIHTALWVLDHPDEALSMALKARNLIENTYSWDTVVAEWDRVFDLALTARRGRGARARSA